MSRSDEPWSHAPLALRGGAGLAGGRKVVSERGATGEGLADLTWAARWARESADRAGATGEDGMGWG